jgi:hypothetical protein
MKRLSFCLSICIFVSQLALAEGDCVCRGLAANFPGYSLICGNQIVDRFPFYDQDTILAAQACEAAKSRYQGLSDPPDSQCFCLDDGNSKVTLITKSISINETLHTYYYARPLPGSLDYAHANCQRQLRQLVRAGVCTR